MTLPSASLQTVQIDLPYACFGVVVKDGVVIAAAPIAKWACGKPIGEVIAWALRKGGKVR